MAAVEPVGAEQQRAARDGSAHHRPRDPYTGVVLIHGIGPVRRNGMLEQALNGLCYWLNHRAGLALRPDGPGRMWLAPELTDDPDPDAPASRAGLDLVAPGAADPRASGPSGVRLEFREVWWAESVGLPPIGATLAWARVQWREQAAHLLVPLGRRVGPSKTAAQTPARETPQALTYRPAREARAVAGPATPPNPTLSSSGRRLARPARWLLRAALWLYDVIQYFWKGVEWLVLTPLIAMLLILMGIVRMLAVVPFLRSAIVAASKLLTDNVMLHWVSEIKVYLTDYTRASAIRQRFQREVEDLLRDPSCDRVIVIAESGGTYIAYEGLTTLLAQQDLPTGADSRPKPVTFVSIATALRRMWVLSSADPHRMRGVLPPYVRWLHFWARYDPVAAGPLTPDSIPPISTWADTAESNPYKAIRASLGRCENVDVVNADSVFTDHTGYWDNMEQVVGPIARELVAGHPALEREVAGHLATRDEVLLRRWSVAWRTTLSFVAGLGAGVGLLIWAVRHPAFGDAVTNLLRRVDWGGVIGDICAPCRVITGNPVAQLPQNPTVEQLGQYSREQVISYLFAHYITVQALIVAALAVAVIGLTQFVVAWAIAKPSPEASLRLDTPEAAHRRLGGLFVVPSIGVTLVFVASIIFSGFVHQRPNFAAISDDPLISAYIWTLGLGELMYALAFVATVVVIVQRRQWGWLVGLLVVLTLLTAADPFVRTVVLAVAAAGCVVSLVRPAHSAGIGGKLALAAVTIMSVDASIGVTLADFQVLHTPLLGDGVFVEYLLPFLIYALWAGGVSSGGLLPAGRGLRRGVLALAIVVLGLTALLETPYIIQRSHLYGRLFTLSPLGPGASSHSPVRALGVLLAVLLGAAMVVLSMADALRQRRRVWLLAMPLLLTALVAGMEALAQVGVESTLPEGGIALACALAGVALIYALWAGQARWRGPRKTA